MEKPPKRIEAILATIIALVILIVFVTFIFRNVLFTPGPSIGIDTLSFTHTAKFIADYWQQYHKIALIDPHWYNNFEIKYAPPLIHPFIIVIYWLTHNIDYAGTLVFCLIALLSALVMFFVLRKKFNLFTTLLGSIMWALAPVVFTEARTKALALVFLPLAFYCTNQLLEKGRYSRLLILAFLLGLSLLAHPMVGLVIMAAMVLYGFLYVLFSSKISGIHFLMLLAAQIFALALVSFYLLPFVLEYGKVSAMSGETLRQTSFFSVYYLLKNIIPVIYILVSFYAVIQNRQAQKTALFILSLLAFYLSLGVNAPIPIVISFIRPSLWIYVATFGFIYLTASAIDFKKTAGFKIISVKIAAALVILILGLYQSDKIYHFTQLSSPQQASFEQELLNKFNLNDGRVMPVHATFGITLLWPELAEATGFSSNDGLYFALARTGPNIAWIFDDIEYDFGNQAINAIKYQNVRYVLMRAEFQADKELYQKDPQAFSPLRQKRIGYALDFLKKLEEDNFKIVYQGKDYILYYKDESSQFIIPIKEKTLIIGNYANTAAAVLSDKNLMAIQGNSTFIDDYDLDFLKHFDSLVLYGFGYHNKKKAEALIKEYAKGGGKVTIDFQGIEKGKLEDLPYFLGVTGIPKKITNDLSLKKSNDSAGNIPTKIEIPMEIQDLTGFGTYAEKPFKEWGFMSYMGLDGSVLKMNENNEETDIVGYKEIEGPEGTSSKVWFIGGNLYYHAFLTHNDQEIEFIKELVHNTDVSPKQNSPTITFSNQTLEPESKKFSYMAEESTPVLISFTYSPYWKAYLDGQEIKIYRVENLMALDLPKGAHQIEMNYKLGNSPIQKYSSWLNVFIIIVLSIPLIIRRIIKPRKDS
ncbi:MAG: 6-pyruvoyl-tetrahydropterin synthase related domain [Candidatus Berkelbacteria bacterium]|nr:6-pyruvoyl-tetrahydropterin synthase related domain [Candidatus Berkelbacteria bacterium]